MSLSLAIDFSGTTATITVITDTEALATATKNLIISVGTDYEDEVGNTPENQPLYDHRYCQLPTVSAADSESNEVTDATNDYIITYTFSEEVVGIPNGSLTASNFDNYRSWSIADDMYMLLIQLLLAVTSSKNVIEITCQRLYRYQ